MAIRDLKIDVIDLKMDVRDLNMEVRELDTFPCHIVDNI